MHFLDALLNGPRIGKAVALAALAAIFALLWRSHWIEKRGVFKNYSRGLGRGLLEVETMLRTERQYVRNPRTTRRHWMIRVVPHQSRTEDATRD